MILFTVPIAMLALATSSTGDPQYSRYFYPLSKRLPAPAIVIDVKELPEQEPWVRTAAELIREWYPTITSLLASENFHSPKVIRLVLKKSQAAPAQAGNGEISIDGRWIIKRPDDFGMMIHELTHIIQDYPDADTTPGWLVEGIADYIRLWRYEPEVEKPHIDPAKNTYHDAYRITGYWLAWVSKRYDMRLVPTLDRDMKAKIDPMPEFQKMTGKTPDELWSEFVADVARR